MEIIPVLDLKAGRVVHARGGARSNYRPLQSSLCPDGATLPLVEAFLEHYTFNRLYIADLDAITETGNHIDQIQLIQQSFPQLELWIDAGIRTAHSFHQFYRQLPGRPVIGSETLTSPELLTRRNSHITKPVLSLDYNTDGILGLSELEDRPDLWPQDVIVMSMDHVGCQQGPDFSRLEQVHKLAENRKVYAAGGIRDDQDLSQLTIAEISGVLTATALHNGRIKPNKQGSG